MIKVIVSLLSASLMVFAMAFPSSALLDDFNDGNFDGWKVQAGEWTVENKAIKFSGGGNCGASLYYEDGTDWTDYEFEVEMRLANHSDYPGGIRVRLEPKSGESYFTWIYPAQVTIISYVATAWDCNANKGQAAREDWEPPAVGEWGKLKLVVKGDVIESWKASNRFMLETRAAELLVPIFSTQRLAAVSRPAAQREDEKRC
jgi:hypothetical protein